MRAVIDSDVLIDYLQGVTSAREELARYDRPACSIISFMELLVGSRTPAERQAAEALLASLERVELNEAVARRAVALRQTLRLKLPDAIVLASAENEGCILVTRNTRDFPANDPRVRFPYTV